MKGLKRRLITGAFGDPVRLRRLMCIAFGMSVVADEESAEAAPRRRVQPPQLDWGMEVINGQIVRYVVIRYAKPRELVGSLLKRAKLRCVRNPADPDYLLEVSEKRRGGNILQSQYWLADRNGEWNPPPGIPGLQLELGHWDGTAWTPIDRPEWPILKKRIDPGLDVRIIQTGFDPGQVALGVLDVLHIAWVTSRRKAVAKVKSSLLPFG